MKLKFLAGYIVTWEVVKTFLMPCNVTINEWTGQMESDGTFCSYQTSTPMSRTFEDSDSKVAQGLANAFANASPISSSLASSGSPGSVEIQNVQVSPLPMALPSPTTLPVGIGE